MQKLFLLLIAFSVCYASYAQEEINAPEKEKSGLQINLNREGTTNVRFVSLMQTWVRSSDLNPGTVYRDQARTSLTDISVRRIVLTTIAQLSPRALVLLNMEGSSNAGDGSFQPGLDVGVLDAYGEYKVNQFLFIGAGLHQWTGLSRMNVDGVGSILNLDQPLFQQATWNKLDRLGRVMGIYAKGDIGKFNYRLSVNEPFATSPSAFTADAGKGSPSGGGINQEAKNAQLNVAYNNPSSTSKLIQGYVEVALWDKENHISPYEINTYHGEKKLLNFGSGFFYRNSAILTPTEIGLRDPALPESIGNPKVVKRGNESDLVCFAADATFMYPFPRKQDGVTIYLAAYHLDLGHNYFTVSPINGITTAGVGVSPINGPGNAFPTTGTGNSYYTKVGYLFPKNWFGNSRVGLFGTYQESKLDALLESVKVYEAGANWFISTNKVKLTVMYRNRPVYKGSAAHDELPSTAVVDQRKGEFITQLQFNF